MIRRFATDLLDAQDRWTDPLGGWIQRRILLPTFNSNRPLKDLLNGTWLGHSLHATVTDVPVGAFTTAIVLDGANVRAGADAAIGVGIAGMVGSAVAGWADYTDTDVPPERGYATLHQLLMLLALSLYVGSLSIRMRSATRRRMLPIGLSLAGYTLMAVSAYIGGEVVYWLGNMVDRHAFRSFASGWRPLEVSNVPDDTPAKVESDDGSLVVVRHAGHVYALDDTCAHAGCGLSEGRLVGDSIECGCHGSRFRLKDGRLVQGPSTFDQPAYQVRRTPTGGFEVRHTVDGIGQDEEANTSAAIVPRA